MRMQALFPELRSSVRGAASGWERMVAALCERADEFPDTEAFEEPLTGLHTRELDAPEVFSRFFGGSA